MTDIKKIKEEIELCISDCKRIRARSWVDAVTMLEDTFEHALKIIDSLSEEPASKDLEEEIKYLSERYPEVSFAKLSRIVLHSTRWQRQQMMKNAVDCEVEQFYNPNLGVYVNTFKYIPDREGLKDGDKVKLIIVKED